MDTLVTKIRTSHGRMGYPKAITLEKLADIIASERHATLTTAGRDSQPQIIFSALFGRNGQRGWYAQKRE